MFRIQRRKMHKRSSAKRDIASCAINKGTSKETAY